MGFGYKGDIQGSRGFVVAASSRATIFAQPAQIPMLNGTSDIRDILNLTPLPYFAVKGNIELNTVAALILAQDQALQTYASFLPSTAGRDAALDAATTCVASAVRDFRAHISKTPSHLTTLLPLSASATTAPPASTTLSTISSPSSSSSSFSATIAYGTNMQTSGQQRTLSLYAIALKHLQEGIKDPKRSSSAELLCATMLLCFFEVSTMPVKYMYIYPLNVSLTLRISSLSIVKMELVSLDILKGHQF